MFSTLPWFLIKDLTLKLTVLFIYTKVRLMLLYYCSGHYKLWLQQC